MKTINAICAAIIVGFIVYWLVRFGAWTGSLMTVRTDFYWGLTRVMAWVFAVIAGIITFTEMKEG